MQQSTLIKRLFGIQGFLVKDIKTYEKRIIVSFDRAREVGEYDRRWCRVRDFNWGDKEVWIEFPKIRYLAPNGLVRNEQLEWLGYYSHLTRRFEHYVAVLCQISTPYQISRFLNFDKSTVYAIEHKYLVQGLLKLELPENLEEIAIDEVSWRKGHRYFTLVTDIKSRKVIWAVQGKTSQALDSFFAAIGPERCAKIKVVAIDMCDAYELSIKYHCPQATLVYDRFHVIKMLNEAINEVRKDAFDSARGKEKALLRNSKWILMKRNSRLTENEKTHLDKILEYNSDIQKAVLLKELFQQVYAFPESKSAEQHLIDCIITAFQSGLKPLEEFAEFIARRKEGIINWYIKHRSTSVSEGINNVVKTLRRMAYGYKNPDYFRLKILQKCGFLEVAPL